MTQVPVPHAALAHDHPEDGLHEVRADLAYERLVMVNVVYWGLPGAGDRRWVLVDTGLAGSAGHIERSAYRRFGAGARPAAIVLTHGHFDHVGAVHELARTWDVPVYASGAEAPHLNGSLAYPAPDMAAGGGLMPFMAPMLPRGPIDISPWLHPLPREGMVPAMPGWYWVATPGHSRGHVSLWRPSDRTLIAGDAFVTTRQESVYSVITQRPEMHGPPRYFTPDWGSARNSVRVLAALEPELVVTGHGRAMAGPIMTGALHRLARDFDQIAVPEHVIRERSRYRMTG